MNPTGLPGQVVDPQDVNRLIDEIVQDPNDPNRQATGGKATEPVKMNIGGQVYEFASLEQAQQAVQQFTTSIVARQQELEAQAKAAGAPAGTLTTGQDDPTQPDLTPRVDPQKFAELVKAGRLDQALDYADNVRYGGVNPKDLLRAMAQRIQQQDTTLTALTFIGSHKELNDTQNAARVGEIMQRMGIPRNNQGFELAYAYAKQHGIIADSQAGQPGPDAGQSHQTPAPPPSMSRRTTSTADPAPDWVARAENMSLDQLSDLINRLERERTT